MVCGGRRVCLPSLVNLTTQHGQLLMCFPRNWSGVGPNTFMSFVMRILGLKFYVWSFDDGGKVKLLLRDILVKC